jgi:hypothetical protein
MSFNMLLRNLLEVDREMSRLIFAAMMPGLTLEQIKALKRQERAARMERKKICQLLRPEIILRCDAMENGRRYSVLARRQSGAP